MKQIDIKYKILSKKKEFLFDSMPDMIYRIKRTIFYDNGDVQTYILNIILGYSHPSGLYRFKGFKGRDDDWLFPKDLLYVHSILRGLNSDNR